MPNAYDQAFQNRVKFDADRRAAAQREEANARVLKRAPILEQREDDDYARRIKAEDVDTQKAADEAQRAAQLRGLLTLQTAIKKGMTPQEAVTALGRGGMKAFGKDLGGMLQFATDIASDPNKIDAQIAGLSGKPAATRRLMFQKEVIGPGGDKGFLNTYDDGTDEFVTDYEGRATGGGSRAAVKVINGIAYDPYTFEELGRVDPEGVITFKAAERFGTGLGESQANAVQRLAAAQDTATSSITAIDAALNHPALDAILGSPDFAKALSEGGLGGLTQFFGDLGVAPGSPAAEAAALLETVSSDTFLQGIQSLKGFGPVTEKEGQAAQKAVSNLSRLREPKAIRQELRRLQGSIQRYYAALEKEAGGGYTGLQAPGPAAPRGGAAPEAAAVPAARTPRVSDQFYDD